MSNNGEDISEEISFLKSEINKLKKENESLKFNSSNFQGFLAKTYLTPKILAPFSNEDKHAFAFMDHLAKYLNNLVSEAEYNPLVSIIMPTYNRQSIIKKAIDSVLTQTYSNFELIIIDDASEDDTVEYLKTNFDDERIKILCNTENRRCSGARNVGLKNAKGEIIMYLDSDNTWNPTYIKTMVGAFIELPDADGIYCGQYLYKGFKAIHPYAIRFCSFNKPLLHNHNFIDMNCFCHKKHIYKEIGGFDEELWRLEDWDLIIRISNILKVYAIPVLLSNYYEHDFKDRLTKTPFKYYDACEILLEKNRIPLQEYKALKKKVSVIIPNYESLNEIKACIDSILSYNFDDMIEIIVVDNNSSIEVLEYLFNAESEGKIKLVSNSEDYDITYSIKKGISRADPDSDLLFLKNDTVITEGSIEHMQDLAYSLSDCGLVVPHEMSTQETNVTTLHVPYAHHQFECDTLPSEIYQNIINLPIFHDGGILELNYAPFFCTYVKREVYNKTLSLDFKLGMDNRSNRIFSDIIRSMLNLKIYQSPYAFVYNKHIDARNKYKKSEDEIFDLIKKSQIKTKISQNLINEKPTWDF